MPQGSHPGTTEAEGHPVYTAQLMLSPSVKVLSLIILFPKMRTYLLLNSHHPSPCFSIDYITASSSGSSEYIFDSGNFEVMASDGR